MTPATFRDNLPEFSDSVRFPDSQITRWLSLGVNQLSADLWGALLERGLELFAAHHLTIWRENADTAARSGAVGIGVGVIASKTVGPVNVTYEAGDALIPGAGAWNLTAYGVQFYQLSRQIGMSAASVYTGAVLA